MAPAPYTLLSIVQSASTGERYEIRRGHDGLTYCNCSAWRFAKSRPKSCKHLRAYISQIDHPATQHRFWDEAGAMLDVTIAAMLQFQGKSNVLPLWEISKRRMREVLALKLEELAPSLGLKKAAIAGGDETSGVRMINLDDDE